MAKLRGSVISSIGIVAGRHRLITVAALVLVSVLVAGGTGAEGATSSGDHLPEGEGHVSVPSWVPAVVSRSGDATGPAYHLRVRVMVDDAFAAATGDAWEREALRVIRSADRLLADVDIALDVAAVDRWHGTDKQGLAEMLAEALDENPPDGDAVVVALTGHKTTRDYHLDGWTTAAHPAAIVRVEGPGDDQTPALLTHELAHILGSHHHDGAVECVEGGGLMDAVGFTHGYRWCHYHREAMSEILSSA